MKIALIAERLVLSRGGAELSVWQLAQALRQQGHRVDIIAAAADQNVDGVVCLCGADSRRRISPGLFYQHLTAYLARHCYDIVHSVLPFGLADVYQPRGGTYIETIRQTAASYRHPVAQWFKRATAFANWRRLAYQRAERRLCQHSAVLIAALSDYVRRQLITHYNLPPHRIAVVPNGVDVRLDATTAEIETVRRQLASLGLAPSSTDTLFLFAANNFRLKGLTPLLEALAAARRAEPTRRQMLVVVGSGNAQPYQRLSRRLGIERQVAFVGYQARIAPWLAVCDAAVLPTWYDPCSRFILEALAAGKPALTTRFNGAAERFENRRHGVIIDTPADIAALAMGLVRLADPNQRRQMAEAIARDELKKELSIETHCLRLEKVYQDILRRKQGI